MICAMPRNRPLILIVEDSPTQREALNLVLTDAGFDVVEARDGARGFEMAESHHPDLILSDIEMPVLDGYALCRAIVNSPDLARIPVIFFSSLDNVESLKMGYEVGARDFLSKREGNDEQILNAIRNNLPSATEDEESADAPRPEPADILQLLHRSSFDSLGFGAAIVDLRRTLRFANQQAKPWFGLAEDQSLGQVDPILVEQLVIGALQTLGMNGDEFMHPFTFGSRTGTVRMEEILNERQEISGLLLLFWARET